jgi:hypothetical protein
MAKLCAAGVTLRDQVNKKWPSRDKASDGWIGDSAHAAREGWGTNGKGSYHNQDPRGIVHAIDLDEDFLGKGKGEKVAKEFAEQLATYCREGKDGGRIAHIVYEDQVASATANNWHFRGSGYSHFQHVHISFTNRADYDGTPFKLPIFIDNQDKPKPSNIPAYPGRNFLSHKQRNKDVKKMQEQLIKKGFAIANGPTGFYGDQTVLAVKEFYLSLGKKKDGLMMDPTGWNALWGEK